MTTTHAQINKIVTLSITIMMIIILFWAIFFIYTHVYQIIILVPRLEELKLQVSFDIVNIDLFNKINEAIKFKTAWREVNWLNLKNPF